MRGRKKSGGVDFIWSSPPKIPETWLRLSEKTNKHKMKLVTCGQVLAGNEEVTRDALFHPRWELWPCGGNCLLFFRTRCPNELQTPVW